MDGARELAAAIVQRAIQDYRYSFFGQGIRTSTCRLDGEHVKTSCESFFRSEWFRTLTNIDGEKVMKAIKEDEHKKLIAEYKKAISGKNFELKLKVRNREGKIERHTINIPPAFEADFKRFLKEQIKALKKDL